MARQPAAGGAVGGVEHEGADAKNSDAAMPSRASLQMVTHCVMAQASSRPKGSLRDAKNSDGSRSQMLSTGGFGVMNAT